MVTTVTIDLKNTTASPITLPSAKVGVHYDVILTATQLNGKVNIILENKSNINGIKITQVGAVWHFKGTPTEITDPNGTTFKFTVIEVANPSKFIQSQMLIVIEGKLEVDTKLPPCMQSMNYLHELIKMDTLKSDMILRIKAEDKNNIPGGLSIVGNMLQGTPEENVHADITYEFSIELVKNGTLQATYPTIIKQLPKLNLVNKNPPILHPGYTYNYQLNITGGTLSYNIDNADELKKFLQNNITGINFDEDKKSFSGKIGKIITEKNTSITISDKKYKYFKITVQLKFKSELIKELALSRPDPTLKTLEPIELNKVYAGYVEVTGGYESKKYSLSPLVPGMTIDRDTGVITGIPQNIPSDNKVEFHVHVEDTPPPGDHVKKAEYILHAIVLYPATASPINIAINSGQPETRIYMLSKLPRLGQNINKIEILDENNKPIQGGKVNGRYGSIEIVNRFTLIYKPNLGTTGGSESIRYKVSNDTSADSGEINFDIHPELTSHDHTITGYYGKSIETILSEEASGGPFDTALTYASYTSSDSQCLVEKVNGEIKLTYKIPEKRVFHGNQIIIEYVLTKRIHTSQLSTVIIDINK